MTEKEKRDFVNTLYKIASPKTKKTILEMINKYPRVFYYFDLVKFKVLVGDVVEYNGNLDFNGLPITHLGNLERINGWLDLDNTKIETLGNLEFVGHWLNLEDTSLTNLGKLKYVGDSFILNDIIKKEDLPKNLIVKGAIYYKNAIY